MSKEREPQPPHDLTLEEVVRQAREVLLANGSHLPMLIVTGTRQNVLGPLSEMAPTHEERVQQLFGAGFALGRAGQAGELKQVFFICESWLSMGQGNTPPVMPPSQDPKRREALIISQLRVEGDQHRQSLIVLEMLRNRQGKLTGVQEMQRLIDEGESRVESPLLLAFVRGFYLGMLSRHTRFH